MMQFEHSSWIAAPVETVFDFHKRRDAIELLMPPDRKVQLVSREGGLEAGARVEFRIPLGPFAAWLHAHRFEEENGGTRLTDSIEMALPGGLLMELLAGWAIKRKLRKMFQYRHEVTRRMCEA